MRGIVLLLDFFLVLICLFLFLPHLVLASLPNDLPHWNRVHLPVLLICLALLTAHRVGMRLLTRGPGRAGWYFEGLFFGLVCLGGAVSSYVITRAVLQISYPRVWDLFPLLLGLWLAGRLPARLKWRKAPLVLSVFLAFHYLFLVTSKSYVDESDFFPVEAAGVRVVHEHPNPLKFDPDGQSAGVNSFLDLSGWLLGKFAGVNLAYHQNGYLALSADQDFLYVNGLHLREGRADIHKIRLDDFSLAAEFRGGRPFFQHMVEDRDGQRLVATSYLARELCCFRAADLELVDRIPAGIEDVLAVARTAGGNLAVAGESGRLAILDGRQGTAEKHLLPMQAENMVADASGRFLVIGGVAGYTVLVYDLERRAIARSRILSHVFYGVCDLSLDTRRDRVFLPLTFKGTLAVVDYHTLATLAEVPLDPGLRCVCYLPDLNVIAVANYFNGKVYFVDGRGYQVLETFFAGTRIRDMTYAAKRGRLYVSTALRVLEVDPKALLPVESHVPEG